jgi:LacI family transcriptional regulator
LNRNRPTILDVAQRAGVSVGTVSNVLNDAIRVSEKRRLRVLKAIKELGYSQNLLAQGLRKRRSTMVGLCVPHTGSSYFSALVNMFEEIASDRGFELMQVVSRHDSKKELERVEALLKYKIGGLILIPSLEPEKTLKLVAQSGTPVVIVDRPTASTRFDQVTFDNRGAMFEATRHLIALGHRRILFIVRQRGLLVTKHRIEGLFEAVRKSGGKATAEVFESGFDEVSLTARLSEDFRKPLPPTAIIVSNSLFAAWAIRAFRSLKINYPKDVSLLAFDEPDWADLVTPRLSVVRQPTEAVARRAWEFLIRRMTNEFEGAQREELKAEVVFRESIEPVAEDPALAKRSRKTRK